MNILSWFVGRSRVRPWYGRPWPCQHCGEVPGTEWVHTTTATGRYWKRGPVVCLTEACTYQPEVSGGR